MSTKLIQVRITNDSAAAIAIEAGRVGKPIKELIETLGIDINEGRLSWNGDTLVPSERYVEAITPKYDYEALGIDRFLETLEAKNYDLKAAVDSMRENAMNAPSQRRKRGMDWGA